MYVLGQTIWNNHTCEPFKTEDVHLKNVEDKSQIAISDEAFSCMMNQWAQSRIGFIALDTERYNTLFKDNITLDTTFMKNKLGVSYFYDKFGADDPVLITISFKDIETYFGLYGVDIVMEYTAIVKVRTKYGHIVMDEFRLMTSLVISNKEYASLESLAKDQDPLDYIDHLEAANKAKDILEIKIRDHKLDMNSEHNFRDKPSYSNYEISRNEYIEFKREMAEAIKYFKDFMNSEVLIGDRVRFPYAFNEIDSTLEF